VTVLVALRVGRIASVILAVTIVTFLLMRALPGDPAQALLGRGASPADLEEVRADLGLDSPPIQQYGNWLWGAVRGDLGTSYRTGRSVTGLVVERAPVTLELVALSQVLALMVAVPLGLWTAHRSGRRLDKATRAVSMGLYSLPGFALGTLLVQVFAVRLQWLPASGFVPWSDSPAGHLRAMVLPVLTLAAWQAAMYTQLLRSDAANILNEEYIETARFKGLSTRRILFVHTLKPGSLSLINMVAVNVGVLIGGAVLIEVLFAWPGLGRLMVDAIAARDLMLVQGGVLVTAVAFVLLNALADVLTRRVDPRVQGNGSR